MIRLQRLNGDAAGEALESNALEVRIGRNAENQVVIDAVHVSGHHASVVYAGDVYMLRDMNSTNGSRVRRAGDVLDLANEPGREVVLESGDELMFGDVESPVNFLVVIDEDADDTSKIVSLRRREEVAKLESEVDRGLLQALYGAQRDISAALYVEDVLDRVARHSFSLLSRATHVTVALRETGDDPKRKASYGPVGTRVRDGNGGSDSVPITRSVFKKVVAERASVLAADAKKDVGETESLMAAQILSTIGVPLWVGEEIVGVLQVDNRAASGVFREQDLDVLSVLAQSASQAFHHASLYERLQDAEERARTENKYLKKRQRGAVAKGIVSESDSMDALLTTIDKVVDTRVSVLIEGETGTGKELLANAVHYKSNRAERLFVVQNCAAVPENLLESELFGHKKGAFTGATEDKKGLFELADGGTLFLDEVGEMPMPLQAKLLRVLQEGEVRPIGGNVVKKVDVRIVAATNRNLEQEVSEGRFREDLYYRLKVFPIRVPPLRERPDDIPPIANHFLSKYSKEFGRNVSEFSEAAMDLLKRYAWPGNVRELENEVQRIVIQADDSSTVLERHVSARVRQVPESSPGVPARRPAAKGTLKEMVEEVEKAILADALANHENNKSATAKTLGITREGLHKKLKNFGMT